MYLFLQLEAIENMEGDAEENHIQSSGLENSTGENDDIKKMLIRINRPLYTQTEFDEGFEVHPRPTKAISERFS